MKKKYTNAEKIGIVKKAVKNGVKATLEKYGLYPAKFYYWKKKYDAMGDAGLAHDMTCERLQEWLSPLEKILPGQPGVCLLLIFAWNTIRKCDLRSLEASRNGIRRNY